MPDICFTKLCCISILLQLAIQWQANSITYVSVLSFVGSEQIIYTSEDSASFEVPMYLQNDKSLQLIWSKDANTQCVCPPVELLISQCACNSHYSNNIVNISRNQLVITNITEEMGEGEVSLYFIFSISSGCRDSCNLRSIAAIYKIVVTQGTSVLSMQLTNYKTYTFILQDIPSHPQSITTKQVKHYVSLHLIIPYRLKYMKLILWTVLENWPD